MFEQDHPLLDHVVHVRPCLIWLFRGDDLLYPARVQVDEETGAAAEIGQVLDR
jgi:hypothetical protein